MAQYIDKSALVTKIEKWITLLTKEKNQEGASKIDKLSLGGRIAELQEVKVFLDTLEIKDVDLDEEINNYFNRISHFGKIHLTPEYDNIKVSTMTIDGFASIAKHFFELGIKAQKGG